MSGIDLCKRSVSPFNEQLLYPFEDSNMIQAEEASKGTASGQRKTEEFRSSSRLFWTLESLNISVVSKVYGGSSLRAFYCTKFGFYPECNTSKLIVIISN
jgi:hypothetical protein